MDGNPRNWHLHPYAQEAALRDAKQEVGWAGALLYNERTKRLIDGHLRKKIAKKRERIPVLVGSWSEEEEAKILATLDPIGMMAQVDKSALEALLASVRFESSAITSLLETMVGEAASKCIVDPAELVEPADQIERADELKKKWKTVKGQLWEAPPGHRIVCGDSTDPLVLGKLCTGGCAERLAESGHENRVQRMEVEMTDPAMSATETACCPRFPHSAHLAPAGSSCLRT